MISKLNEHAALVRFEITSMISDQNCTTQGSITTLLHPFWNSSNKYRTWSVQIFYWSSTELVWNQIQLFFWGKNNSFGNKSCRICHIILFVSHFPAQPKLHSTRFNYHFITTILKSPKYRTSNILLMQYWAGLKLNSSIFWGGKSKSWQTVNKSCKICHMILLCLSFFCNLIGYFEQAFKSDWLFCF